MAQERKSLSIVIVICERMDVSFVNLIVYNVKGNQFYRYEHKLGAAQYRNYTHSIMYPIYVRVP